MSLICKYLSSAYRKKSVFFGMSSPFLFTAHIGYAFLDINAVSLSWGVSSEAFVKYTAIGNYM